MARKTKTSLVFSPSRVFASAPRGMQGLAVAHNNKDPSPSSAPSGFAGDRKVASEPDTSGDGGAEKFEKSKHFMN